MEIENLILEKADIERVIGQSITDFSISAGSDEGDNCGGDLKSIQVITKSGEKLNVIYKSFPSYGRDYVIQSGIFRVEVCMYEKVFPRIQELLNEKKSETGEKIGVKLPIPKFISGLNDDQNDYVCMEDMRHKGFKMQDKYHSLTVAEVSLVMTELAKLHAMTYFLVRYDGEKLFEEDDNIRRIKYNRFTVEDDKIKESFSRMFKNDFDSSIELLEPRHKELAEHARKFSEKYDQHQYYALLRSCNNRTDKKIFACIIHGDLWTNNILFKYAKERDRDTPTELRFIDFQLTRRGNVFEDLGYFFWTSTTPAFRKFHLVDMLNEYYKSFENTMSQLAFPMPENFTRGSFFDDFYTGILSAYLYMPCALLFQMDDLPFTEENADEISNEQKSQQKAKPHGIEVASNPTDLSSPEIEKLGNDAETTHKSKRLGRRAQRFIDLTREIVEMKLLQ